VLGVPRTRLLTISTVHPSAAVALDRLIKRRAGREPLQHILGRAPFRHVMLSVGPGVFIPRPETEQLVEWGLAVAGPAPLAVDLCSGSGAIALSVARERSGSTVYAVEQAPSALVWLRRNVAATEPRVVVVEGDATAPATLATLDGSVDLVLCNPPYVPASARLEPEVAEHDPAEAVFGGPDGLALIPGIARRSFDLLRPGGWLGIEHDDTQGSSVPALLRAAGFVDVEDRRDLADRPRFAVGRRPPLPGRS